MLCYRGVLIVQDGLVKQDVLILGSDSQATSPFATPRPGGSVSSFFSTSQILRRGRGRPGNKANICPVWGASYSKIEQAIAYNTLVCVATCQCDTYY